MEGARVRMKLLADRRGKRILKRRFGALAAVLLLFPPALAYRYANREVVLSVPYISQQGVLATGCELVSAAMVLRYCGVPASVEDVAARTPRADLTWSASGLSGEHPARAFIGDPHSPEGFGCYAPVIVSVLNSFLKGTGRKAVDRTGSGLAELALSRVAKGDPVLVWVTMNMKEPRPGKSWKLWGTGETFRWIAGEHCMVLVGFSADRYYFNDPYESNGLVSYDRKLAESRYEALGRQAAAVEEESTSSGNHL